MIDKKIINLDKDYTNKPPLLLGEDRGLFDTVNKHYPEIWRLYKAMKSLDWDEQEFDYTSCINDFKTCSPSVYDKMIKTLAFQWEADTVAARTSPISGVFLSNDEAWACDQRISDNEVVHAATYSEIVRNSFTDPRIVLDEVKNMEESLSRLVKVSEVFSQARIVAHKYAVGEVENNQETYNTAFMYYVALLILERVLFMSSFAVTFTICDSGLFQPIGAAVQKIAKDELNVHVKYRKELLKEEMKTNRGKIALLECKDIIYQLISEVDFAEDEFLDYLFSDGEELVGNTKERFSLWKDWCLKDVCEFFSVDYERTLPDKDPMPFLGKRWLDTNSTQRSPQEEIGAYQVNIMKRDDSNTDFDFDL